jgi:hypothetical protein
MMLDYQKWERRALQARRALMAKVLDAPWKGDQGWEGRTIGLHLPLTIRNHAISEQERLGLHSMKEVLFKALCIGLAAMKEMPSKVEVEKPSIRIIPMHGTPTRPIDHDAQEDSESTPEAW